jgi:hypothetical protein
MGNAAVIGPDNLPAGWVNGDQAGSRALTQGKDASKKPGDNAGFQI